MIVPCPDCNSYEVYSYEREVNANASDAYGPHLLPGLNPNWLSAAKFIPVVCRDCGLVRFYASEKAREKLETSDAWVRITLGPDISI